MDGIGLNTDAYRTLVEQAPIMIWRSGLDAKCDYFNEAWLKFTGRSLQQEVGDGWAEGVHPADLDRCLSTYLDAFHERRPFEMEYRLKSADGVHRWILDRGAPYLDEQGRFAGYIGSCIDVHQRREAEEELERTRASLLRSVEGIITVCSDCRKVRKADGCWDRLEDYIRGCAPVEFSHGLCPPCAGGRDQLEAPGKRLLLATLLVVDDQPVVIATLQRFFSSLGCEVKGVCSAEEALEALAQDKFDLVLLDHLLPGQRGLDVLPELRRRSGLPVIVMSGHYDAEFRKEALARGAADCFPKPFEYEKLSARVQALLDERRSPSP